MHIKKLILNKHLVILEYFTDYRSLCTYTKALLEKVIP